MTAAGIENCETPTSLPAELGESVEFDTRIQFRHGGSCRLAQNVRHMLLCKENGAGDPLFICSNLGALSNNPICEDSSRVLVSFQGSHKYDIKLLIRNLTEADAGRYHVEVELDGFLGPGRMITIRKNFLVTIQGMRAPPPIVTGRENSTDVPIPTATTIPGPTSADSADSAVTTAEAVTPGVATLSHVPRT